MKIAIHQPNYLPWPGYFYKISHCDVFVFLDDVQLNKRSYTRRVKIRHQAILGKDRWLTVPLKKFKEDAKINTLIIDHSKDWIRQHTDIIHNTYQHFSGWDENRKWLLHEVFTKCSTYTLLAEMNMYLVKKIAERLKIQCKFLKSSDLNESGTADTYTYRIMKRLGGTTYIRGKGEQRYAKDPAWDLDPDIQIKNISYDRMIKQDEAGTWKNGFSIVDGLMCGAVLPYS